MTSPADQIAIVDYGLGNLSSVKRALHFVGADAVITDSPNDLVQAKGIILPGVGAFGSGMEGLRKRNLILPMQEAVAMGKPLLGICLGMQLIMSSSEEFGFHEGLNFIEGRVTRFENPHKEEKFYKIPQVGWNKIGPPDGKKEFWSEDLLKGLQGGDYMYFVHSFVVVPKNLEYALASSQYGHNIFCSAIQSRNVFGTQFHPEKSGPKGLQILRNFVALTEKGNYGFKID